MVKILCIVLAAIIVIGLIATIGFIGVKIGGYMIHQNFDFGTAWDWAWADYGEFMQNLLGQAKAENDDYFEYTYTINQYIDVVPCVDLWK